MLRVKNYNFNTNSHLIGQQGGNHALQTIPFQEQFGGIAEVDYSLVSGPTFGSNYLTLNSKGEFYYLPQKQVCSNYGFLKS